MTNINTVFCRELLKRVMEDVRPHTTVQQRRDAWVYHFHGSHWEFHGPDDFYWHGNADNATHARAHGWSAWLQKHHPSQTGWSCNYCSAYNQAEFDVCACGREKVKEN